MKCLESYKKIPVHTRHISVSTYLAGEDAVMVEGVLKDDRLREIFSITTGHKVGPGVVHEIVLRLLVRGPSLRIEDLEVEYVRMPRQECHETADSLKGLVGQTISPGFTSMVKKTFGGSKGCTHLNALLISMAPAVVQGFWSSIVSRPLSPVQATSAMDAGFLIDSCRVWRSDGPLAQDLRRALAHHGGSPDRKRS